MSNKINSCPFCENLNMIKNINERELKKPFSVEYTAVLRVETYYEENLRGTSRHGGYDLNYCPTCGKSLKEAQQ